MRVHATARAVLLLAAALLGAPPARAQPAPVDPDPAGLPETSSAVPGGQTNVAPDEVSAPGLWSRANLFGDGGGLRTRLAARGITLGLLESTDVIGNLRGGTRRTAVFEGLAQLSLGLDTQKAFGLAGGTFNVSAYQIHGRGLSQNALGNNLHTVSSLEAERGTLLFELWYEQALLGGALAIRAGQLAADQEFMTSQYANLFTNHTFGWSTFPSVDLPSGGPSYPLATPGVRVRLRPRDDLTVLAGVFNGNPAGPGQGTPQSRDPSGTAFRLNDDAFAILEVQLAINQADGATGLPGTYKLGGYHHGGGFADQRRNAEGQTLADPSIADTAARHRRTDFAAYAVADQTVWRPGKDATVSVFARIMGAPGDRNLVNVYADTGVAVKGALPGRPDDTAGLAFAIARISDTATQLDRDAAFYGGGRPPLRRHESVLELTYQAQVAPWWQMQPMAQYVFNINGNGTDPARPGKRVGDALVLGLRTAVTF